MRIAFLSVWFSENMGYIENCLPAAMASLGHEVHVVTSTAQVYYNDPSYTKVYRPYLGDPVVPETVKTVDGFFLHRIDFGSIQGKIYLKKIGKVLKKIRPDIVQTFDAFSFLTLQGAYYKMIFKYKLFTANHIVESVFPLLNKDRNNLPLKFGFFLTRSVPGRLVSSFTSRCYPATIDAMRIAIDYYKVPEKKVLLAPLGVDTDLFYPVKDDSNHLGRRQLRASMGIPETDLLCIYTGRLTEGKNPLCLAKAIAKLAEKNEHFKALFLGEGPQSDEIKKLKNCILHKFVPYNELPDYYRAADIGIWPRQESTSMLDAAACGLPVIISDRVRAVERVEGNGLTYIENDVDDMMKVLMSMKDTTLRIKLGTFGVEKIAKFYSWKKIAADRIEDYRKFLNE